MATLEVKPTCLNLSLEYKTYQEEVDIALGNRPLEQFFCEELKARLFFQALTVLWAVHI